MTMIKKLFSKFLFIFLGVYIYAEHPLDGTWMYGGEIITNIKKREVVLNFSIEEFTWGIGKSVTNTTLNIDVENEYFLLEHFGLCKIRDIMSESNLSYVLDCQNVFDSDYWGGYLIWRIQFDFIDEYSFKMKLVDLLLDKDGKISSLETIEKNSVDIFPYNKVWYCVSSPAKIPLRNATLNDSKVRLRTKPNLDCDVWTLLDSGYQVKIKDKSTEPQTIDGESWYWYKVESKGYPDGWIYGKYLDIKE